ncbi:MAG: zinc ribbon domain-containing protein [Actinobacteria bacterium]|nr:zinc ribbon domain-containing protein [Actinomycetota bacterium]
MRCPNCGYDNPEGRRYCEECGEKIARLEAEKARARRKALREAARLRLELEKEGLSREEVERRLRRARRRTTPMMGVLLLLGLVVLAVVLIVVLSGGESEPEKAVKAFYQSIKDKDVLTYLKHTEPDVFKMARSGEYQPDPYTEGIDYDYYVLEDLRTRLVREEGEYAEVEVTGGFFEGFYDNGVNSGGVDFGQHPRLVKLVKVEGTWIVQEYATAKLPYPVEELGPAGPEFPEAEEGEGG